MLEIITIKSSLVFFITLLTIYCFLPYIIDTIRGKTKPHIYTWIIFTLTSSVAFLTNLYSGGGLASIPLGIVILLNIFIVSLSLKYGTKDIDIKDKMLMLFAIISLIIWYFFNNLFLSIIIATLVDVLGYIPTIRKVWSDPKSETQSFWFMIGLSQFLTIFTNKEYNFYTCFYLICVCIFSWSVFIICKTKDK